MKVDKNVSRRIFDGTVNDNVLVQFFRVNKQLVRGKV